MTLLYALYQLYGEFVKVPGKVPGTFIHCDVNILPDKFARFLFEFHAHRFESLDLPFIPADRSDFDVHRALPDDKVFFANMIP